MGADVLHLVFETWAALIAKFMPGVEASKVLSVIVPLAPAAYGIMIKWRNSGYRLLDRLEDFLKHEDKKLTDSRAAIAAIVAVPSPVRSLDQPAFSARPLGRALKKMDWGYGQAALNDLDGASRISADQARLSQKQSEQHKERQALAHLLLGTRAASRQISDAHDRMAARSEALGHFEKALEINPKDVDALEYSGMMLLELANPSGALARFRELTNLRQAEGGLNLARAYRLQATAYENLPQPMYSNANQALLNALINLPDTPAIQRALTHEHHGYVRIKMGNANNAANSSLQSALTIYHSLRATAEGKAGLDRVNSGIAALNRQPSGDVAPNDQPSGRPPPATAPSGMFGLFAKTAKTSG
jgi:tetratricopeptide (TPR) repeat protein